MSDANSNFDFLSIPKEFILNHDLKWIEKALLSEIMFFSKNGECFASNEYFADFLGVSKDRIKHLIPDLVKRGYLNSELKYNHEKQKKERILTLKDQSAKNDTTQSAKNDTTIYKSEYNSNIYTVTNTCSKVNIEHDNNILSATVNCSMLSAETATESHEHIEEVHFTHDGQIETALSDVYNHLHLIKDTVSQDKIADFFLYFTKRYTEYAGHKPYPVKIDKLTMYVERLVGIKLVNGGYDSLLNYDSDSIQWMIDDYFDYRFDDCNYSIHHFMSKKVLSTRFRRLQNRFSKIA